MSTAELFDDDAVATGYAYDRPPVHPHLMARLQECAQWVGPVERAVDVGCGAGASTAALLPLARRALGVDPYVPMVRAARRSVRGAVFAVATAEAVPCAAGSVDLLAAAGALNYADLDAFVRDADRVLAPGGLIAVSNYGFGRPTGHAFRPDWLDRFAARWPRPASTPVDASSFAASAFRVVADDRFVATLPMTRDAYLAYVLTDTAVAQAIAAGASLDEVRAWCAAALVDDGEGNARPVVFDCTLLVLTRAVAGDGPRR